MTRSCNSSVTNVISTTSAGVENAKRCQRKKVSVSFLTPFSTQVLALVRDSGTVELPQISDRTPVTQSMTQTLIGGNEFLGVINAQMVQNGC